MQGIKLLNKIFSGKNTLLIIDNVYLLKLCMLQGMTAEHEQTTYFFCLYVKLPLQGKKTFD